MLQETETASSAQNELDQEREQNSERLAAHKLELAQAKQNVRNAHQKLQKAQARVRDEAEAAR